MSTSKQIAHTKKEKTRGRGRDDRKGFDFREVAIYVNVRSTIVWHFVPRDEKVDAIGEN